MVFQMFFISGFCGLLYQIVWIRLAYAYFGIITPVMSIVISVFMLGLLLGSSGGGIIVRKLVQRFRVTAILFYALAEFLIGVSAFCVPKLFSLEQHLLLCFGSMNSFGYLTVSGLALAVSLLPWCILMGFTYPFMMTFIREIDDRTAPSSFSFLYLANVIGAMSGTIITAGVLIELFGFTHTLAIAAMCNFLIASASVVIGMRYLRVTVGDAATVEPDSMSHAADCVSGRYTILFLLFINGFASMCMEIIWTRNFTRVLGNVVYSFATLLAAYLFACWIGSYLYRKHLSRSRCFSIGSLLGAIALSAPLPLLMNDPMLPYKGAVIVLLSIMPICGILGYLTPLLIDRYSKGLPSAAGRAYAVNTLGCIAGPLSASYLFLPVWGVKTSLLLLSTLLMVCYIVYTYRSTVRQQGRSIAITVFFFLAMVSTGWFLNDTYEEYFLHHSPSVMQRDYAATVTALGSTREDKRLVINGLGMTVLTPVTQFMAHLPLAYYEKKPASALVICFGMGTTFRSLLTWGISATAVELIPGVPKTFGYFWSDAYSVLNNPLGKMVIDDGRRYLMRTVKKYDVVTLDPPPPLKASGSSLLYSVEMYSLIKERLNDGGILQQWTPMGHWCRPGSDIELSMIQAVARSIATSFPYVKVFQPIEGRGYHFLASMKPFRQLSAEELVSRMPAQARRDLVTWCPDCRPEEYIKRVLSKEVPLDELLSRDPNRIITDDKPFNEYYLLRSFSEGFKSLLAEYVNKFFRNPAL
ncbi:MAG: hypothetical protein ABSF80_13285 [Chitinispirillaceae bacterium]